MTHEPRRLLDDVTTEPAARALLEAARRHAPVRYDVARGAARLRAALTGTPASMDPYVPSAPGAGAGALVSKGLVLLVSVAVAVVVTYPLARRAAPESLPGAACCSDAPQRMDSAAASLQAPGPAALAPEAGGAVQPAAPTAADRSGTKLAAPEAPRVQMPPAGAAARRTATRRRAQRAQEGAGSTPVAKRAPVESNRGERGASAANVNGARASSRAAEEATEPGRGADRPIAQSAAATGSPNELECIAWARRFYAQQPRTTLALLTQLRRDHPRGYFVEEREALIVLALAAAGEHAEARAAAAAFVRSYPLSPFVERVRAAAR